MRSAITLAALAILAGCAKSPDPQEIVRPVRVFRVENGALANAPSFAGEVKARYETRLSFRVTGKLISRHVEVGERVRKGQLLAQMDPTDYQLAASSLSSQLAAARAERDFARDDMTRHRKLLELKYISQANYERAETRYKAAQDSVRALEAQLAQARNQAAYTSLYADRDGVVTAIEAETGQVVASGQIVMRIAQLDEKEVAIDVPENRVSGLRNASDVAVTLWAGGDRRLKGRIREIAPNADPATRTYSVKVTLLEGSELARLGMTATVHLPAVHTNEITVPLTAVFQPQQDPSRTHVWVVDENARTVRSVPVAIGRPAANQRVSVEGLEPGMLIVSAGANRLSEGQTVRLSGEEKAQVTARAQAARIAAKPAHSPGTVLE